VQEEGEGYDNRAEGKARSIREEDQDNGVFCVRVEISRVYRLDLVNLQWSNNDME
jgi:hypothetical protein